MFQAALSSRSEFPEVRTSHTAAALIACNAQVVKATIQLQTRAHSRSSASTDMVEARVEKRFAGAYRFDCLSKVDQHPTVRGLTPADLVMIGEAVRTGSQAGSGRLLVSALSHWFGVMPIELATMHLLSHGPGLIRIDPTSSYAVVRLRGVLTELARAAMPGVMQSDDDLLMPLAACIGAANIQLAGRRLA